jgi:hypothetical protein
MKVEATKRLPELKPVDVALLETLQKYPSAADKFGLR